MDIASQAGHWYAKDGSPMYEVPRAKGDGMRPANLADARKLDLVPSVTLILRCASAPGLENWKLTQLLEASLTLPRIQDESMDDFAERVILDSQEQGKKAAERGTALHAAIEEFIKGKLDPFGEFQEHIEKLYKTMLQLDIDIMRGNAERSFASEDGYGGKIDYSHDSGLVIDFKTKDRVADKKTLVYDDHIMQLAAYGYGLFVPPFRALNVFIGIEDKEVRVFEHSWPDLQHGWDMFQTLFRFWKLKNRFPK